MNLSLIRVFVISLLYLQNFSEAANIKYDEVQSLKAQLKDLQSEVLKQYEAGKLEGQLQIFQKWYEAPKKCSADVSSYIFGDWATIQRRVDGLENFHRNWSDYRNGFGDRQENFFIGLEELHTLTTEQGPQELLVLLGDDEGKVAYAKYDNFVVGSEKEKYELKELGAYTGDAGDSLRYHVGKQFSTFDEDNNNERQRCAKVWVGGWWFGDCFESNLNGSNMKHKSGSISNEGVVWKHWHGMNYSLKFAQMMLRAKV